MDAFQAENNEKLAISTLEDELNNAKLSVRRVISLPVALSI